MPTEYSMPQPDLGDTVLFSRDMSGFSQPTIGWVTKVGATTISILTFSENGFVDRHSVHHRCDPALLEDHGWHDLGCWEFAKGTLAIRELTHPTKAESKSR